MSAFVIGLGSSGALAEDVVRAALVDLRAHPALAVRATSDLLANPAVGGATTARFVNAAVVVETALDPRALLLVLQSIESAHGRVRGKKNAARSLDLDILWGLDLVAPLADPAVPHPRMLERAFAVLPATQAIQRAGRVVPGPVADAARGFVTSARRLPAGSPSPAALPWEA